MVNYSRRISSTVLFMFEEIPRRRSCTVYSRYRAARVCTLTFEYFSYRRATISLKTTNNGKIVVRTHALPKGSLSVRDVVLYKIGRFHRPNNIYIYIHIIRSIL